LGSSLEAALSPSSTSGSSSSAIENPSVEAAATLEAGVPANLLDRELSLRWSHQPVGFAGLLPPLKLSVTGLSETGNADASAGTVDTTSATEDQISEAWIASRDEWDRTRPFFFFFSFSFAGAGCCVGTSTSYSNFAIVAPSSQYLTH
jgi:hypothetical protein